MNSSFPGYQGQNPNQNTPGSTTLTTRLRLVLAQELEASGGLEHTPVPQFVVRQIDQCQVPELADIRRDKRQVVVIQVQKR